MVETTAMSVNINVSDVTNDSYKTENSEPTGHLMSWLSISAEYVVISILLLALLLKLIFFEGKGDVATQSRSETEEESAEVETNDLALDNSNAADTNTSSQEQETLPFIQKSSIFPLSGVGGGWIENDSDMNVEYADKEVQTDEKFFGTSDSSNENSLPKNSQKVRSVEDCLEIYKSEVRILYKTHSDAPIYTDAIIYSRAFYYFFARKKKT